MEFERLNKENKPVIAICYDFDRTLTITDMQAQGFIQSVYKGNITDFWNEVNDLSQKHKMDQTSAYMFLMKKYSHGQLVFTKETLEQYGRSLKFYPGMNIDWFDRINNYGKGNGIIVEHYVISSGNKEIIEGSELYKSGVFTEVYANSFMYDEDNVGIWPAQLVNGTNKTQFLFRISKGILDINDNGVNDYMQDSDRRIPFNNMIYIGDSDTDIPCMKIIKNRSGVSVGVYDEYDRTSKEKILKLYNENRINFFCKANYLPNSDIEKIVYNTILKTSVNNELKFLFDNNINEVNEYNNLKNVNNDEIIKNNLIIKLYDSDSFTQTHTIIAKLNHYDNFSDDQIINLCRILIYNNQVNWIKNDRDISSFYKKIIREKDISDSNVQNVKEVYSI